MVGGRNVYNIEVTQSYKLILQSSGLCITKQPVCRLENALNPFGRRRKRNLDRKSATLICDIYMNFAYKIARDVMSNTGSRMAEHAHAACINDVSLSGDYSVSLFISIYISLIILNSGEKVLSILWY